MSIEIRTAEMAAPTNDGRSSYTIPVLQLMYNKSNENNGQPCNNGPCSSKDNSNGDGYWRTLMERQNELLSKLIDLMRKPLMIGSLRLPPFNPETQNINPRAWLTTADTCVTEQHQEGPSLMMALCRALKGEAATWFMSIAYPGMTWNDFKSHFTEKYAPPETAASFLINLDNQRNVNDDNMVEYYENLTQTLQDKLKDFSPEEIAIGIAIAQGSKHDVRLKTLVSNSDITTNEQLMQAVKRLTEKRAAPNETELSTAKRPRTSAASTPDPNPAPDSDNKCNTCGAEGHTSAQCENPVPPQSEQQTSNATPNSIIVVAKHDIPHIVICSRCKQRGHYAIGCAKPGKKLDKGKGKGKSTNNAEAPASNASAECEGDGVQGGAQEVAAGDRVSGAKILEFLKLLRGIRILEKEKEGTACRLCRIATKASRKRSRLIPSLRVQRCSALPGHIYTVPSEKSSH